MLAIIKQFVRRMLMGKGKGILQVAPKKEVDKFAKDLYKKFKDNGVPDEAIRNPDDVKVIWNQITNREAQIVSTNMDDIIGGLRKTPLSKKSAEVLKFPSGGADKVPVTKQFTGQSFSADDHIKFIKSKPPIEAMKEANSIIGRKGRYKNITHEEADRILKDVDDHIFQRDVPMDEPPDLASGGIARVGYNPGGIVKGGKWVIKNLRRSYDELIEGKGKFSTIDSMHKYNDNVQKLDTIEKILAKRENADVEYYNKIRYYRA